MVGCYIMSLAFIKLINDYVIDATLEASDEDILSNVGQEGCPSWDVIHQTQSFLHEAIEERRRARLEQKKAEYQTYKNQKDKLLRTTGSKKTLGDMLSDIVRVMQNSDAVPKPVSMAFREQSKAGNDDAIREIWQALVDLGLIDLGDEKD